MKYIRLEWNSEENLSFHVLQLMKLFALCYTKHFSFSVEQFRSIYPCCILYKSKQARPYSSLVNKMSYASQQPGGYKNHLENIAIVGVCLIILLIIFAYLHCDPLMVSCRQVATLVPTLSIRS